MRTGVGLVEGSADMLNGRSTPYVDAAIRGEVSRLAAAQVGERNDTLFEATASLASLGVSEGDVIRHLRPSAEGVGLRGREFYSTIKSGMKSGRSRPRGGPVRDRGAVPAHEPPGGIPARPAFVQGGDDGPPVAHDEIRRHFYRRNGRPVRVKIKRRNGYVNWYRVSRGDRDGWQAGKRDGYTCCPYFSELDPFDAELAGDILYWPEGEKDCDTLGTQALPAFTFGGTGDGLPNGCADYVRGRHLVILADNDGAGIKHAERKAQLAEGIAATIKVVTFSELPTGGDVSDYLHSHTISDLEKRVAETPVRLAGDPPAAPSPNGRALLTCNLSDITPEKVEWLWPGRVGVGKITMIAGEPGLGKSQLSLAVAAAVTTGGHWPDNNNRTPLGSVIILSAEDGLADTIRPRFDAAGGDPAKVSIIRAVKIKGRNGRQSFDLAADLELLEAEIQRRGDVRLVLIDPVSSYLGKLDSHKNAEVRSALEPLGEMAERLRLAVLAVTHLSKGDGKAINRLIGSIAFVAAARTVFAVVADPDDETSLRRLLLQVKNNIAPPQPGLAFRLLQREVAPGVIGSAVDWDDTRPVTLNVDQALSGFPTDNTNSATEDACQFLRDVLAGGPVDVLDIEAQARAAAMLSDTKRLRENKPFRTASNRIGVVAKRIGFGPGARVQWSLPGKSEDGGAE
jgi:hypothetical protein